MLTDFTESEQDIQTFEDHQLLTYSLTMIGHIEFIGANVNLNKLFVAPLNNFSSVYH